MARSREESQKVVSFAISGAVLFLLSLGYLFVPRADLEDKSPLEILIAPTKTVEENPPRYFGVCSGAGVEIFLSRTFEDCEQNGGEWTQQVRLGTGFEIVRGKSASDVCKLIAKDVPATGGLFFLIGASPAIGFLVFRRITGNDINLKTPEVILATSQQNKPDVTIPPKATSRQLEDRLQHLQSLHQKALITSEEFSIKKKELLEEI